jgi:RNA polymerase subunit RPABC4/transcription elongation factor Spt4
MPDILDEVLANPAVSATGSALGIAVVVLWLAAAWWAYSDAAHRTESSILAFFAAAWIVLSTPLMLPLSLLVYTFVRPQIAAGDQRTRALVQELGATAESAPTCPGCSRLVETGWLRCPECTTWLAAPCVECGSWSDSRLEICPWCGSEDREAPSVVPVAPVGAATLRRMRHGRVAWRAMGPGSPKAQLPLQRVPVSPDGRPLAPVRARA